MQLNKGRFKCPHEAQAVWNMVKDKRSIMIRARPFSQVLLSFIDSEVEKMANALYKARLIHGTIYDEDGRIEDKDVAHELWLSYQENGWWFNNLDGHILDIVRHKKIRGTIFYE